MVRRKVQIAGGSTFTVTLPKSWTEEHGIRRGSLIDFYPEDDALWLTPHQDGERTKGVLDIAGLDDAQLARAVTVMYISGFDIITLETGRLSTTQRRTIRDTAQGLIGLEVIAETASHIQLQDFMDSSELSLQTALTRMHLVATEMLADAVTALIENDADLSRSVIQRDDDVDRFWAWVSRVFRSELRAPGRPAGLGIDRETSFDYHTAARQLERVADHATKIAHQSPALDEIPPAVTEALVELYEAARDVIETAMEALLEDDSDEAVRLANQAQEQVEAIETRSRDIDALIRDLDSRQATVLGLVADSLERSASYGGNIAESAQQKAALKP